MALIVFLSPYLQVERVRKWEPRVSSASVTHVFQVPCVKKTWTRAHLRRVSTGARVGRTRLETLRVTVRRK